MAAEYQVREIPGGLQIAAVLISSFPWRALTALVVAVAIGFVVHPWVEWPNLLLVALVPAILVFVLGYSGSRSVLTATNLEFQASGRCPGSIPRADIQYMTYGYGPGEHDPPGLYANGRVCLLPYVNEEQSNEIAKIIYDRFADMPLRSDQGRSSILFRPLTTLDLSSPK